MNNGLFDYDKNAISKKKKKNYDKNVQNIDEKFLINSIGFFFNYFFFLNNFFLII